MFIYSPLDSVKHFSYSLCIKVVFRICHVRKVDSSQLQISFGTPTSPELCLVQQSATEDQDAAATNRCGNLSSWQEFASVKWQDKHLWLLVKGDGVYCKFCSMHMSVLMGGGSATFVSEPFTSVSCCSMKSQTHMNLLLPHYCEQSRDAA